MLQDHGIILAGPDDKAIWKATVTSDTGWSHSFTFLKLSPALIWEPTDRPAPFAGTVIEDVATATATATAAEESGASQAPTFVTSRSSASPVSMASPAQPETAAANPTAATVAVLSPAPAQGDAMEDLLSLIGDSALTALAAVDAPTHLSETAQPQSIAPPPTPCGQHFMAWLKQGIVSRKLIINDARALVHTVADTAYLVSPGVFQRYAQERLQVATLAKQDNVQEWQWVQKRFQRLLLHRKLNSGLNIWVCEVAGPRKSRRLHGYLLQDPAFLFDDLPPNNPYLRVV